MMGKSHLVISTGLTLSAMQLAGLHIGVPAVAVTVLSSLLPDIDEPNSLLVRKALPTFLLRILQLALIAGAIYWYLAGISPYPWNLVMALLVASVAFLPGRRLRQLVMLLLAATLMAYGNAFDPWNAIVGCILVIAAVVPHRGLTHTLYGLAGWTALLYFAGRLIEGGDNLWIAGGLSYGLHLLADSLTQRGITPLPPLEWKLRLKLMSTGTKKGGALEAIFVMLTLAAVTYTFVLTR
ncbi:inner membrane protein [compost metagenome]